MLSYQPDGQGYIMNKYTELSDFEINKKVFIELYGKESLKDKDMVMFFDRKDYCYNPSDAMPIIIKNRISLRNRYEGDWEAETEWGMPFESINKNPLRACMEVFLMMKDEESKND